MIDYTAEQRRQAAELRQYQEITRAVHAAARTYAHRTGSHINETSTTNGDLAADAYIILREAQQATGGPRKLQGDQLRQAAYEAVRRAARAQRRAAHVSVDGLDELDLPPTDPDALADAIAIRQAIAKAGPIAALLAQGFTVSDISRRRGVSISTAWRLAERARGIVAAELGYFSAIQG